MNHTWLNYAKIFMICHHNNFITFTFAFPLIFFVLVLICLVLLWKSLVFSPHNSFDFSCCLVYVGSICYSINWLLDSAFRISGCRMFDWLQNVWLAVECLTDCKMYLWKSWNMEWDGLKHGWNVVWNELKMDNEIWCDGVMNEVNNEMK